MGTGNWETAFVAVSALLGESLDECVAALGPEAVGTRDLVAALQSGPRESRARALAAAVSQVASAVEATRLA